MEVRGHRVHVEVRGVGDPVIAVHSSGMSGKQWRRLARDAAPTFRVVVPDLLGSGESDPWRGPGLEAMAADRELVRTLLEQAGAAHLVGHSYGGTLVLLEALHAPGRVLSVAAYEPAVLGDVDHDPGPIEAGPEVWMAWLVDWWNGAGTFQSLGETTRRELQRSADKVMWEVRCQLADRTPLSAFACIEAPVLLLRGDSTPEPVRSALDTLAGILPKAVLEVVPGAGHMGPVTHPGRVAERLLTHLRCR